MADLVWLRDRAEDDIEILRGGFHTDVAVIKECGEETMDIGRYILDAKKIKLGDGAGEEPELLHVHDAVVRYNPNVEIVINEVHEEEKIDAQVVDARGKYGDDIEPVAIKQCREAGGNDEVDEDRGGEQNQKQPNLRQERQRMPAQDVVDLFVGLLMDEMGDIHISKYNANDTFVDLRHIYGRKASVIELVLSSGC